MQTLVSSYCIKAQEKVYLLYYLILKTNYSRSSKNVI